MAAWRAACDNPGVAIPWDAPVLKRSKYLRVGFNWHYIGLLGNDVAGQIEVPPEKDRS